MVLYTDSIYIKNYFNFQHFMMNFSLHLIKIVANFNVNILKKIRLYKTYLNSFLQLILGVSIKLKQIKKELVEEQKKNMLRFKYHDSFRPSG